MISKFKLFIIGLIFISTSCNDKVYKAMQELKNLPPVDYSYVVEPHFSENREAIELKVKELYFAEEVRIGVFKIHSYDKETKKQIDQKFWPQVVVLNSNNLKNYRIETDANVLAINIGKYITSKITNLPEYDKIQITFIRQWNEGGIKQEKRTVYLTIPEFKPTEF